MKRGADEDASRYTRVPALLSAVRIAADGQLLDRQRFVASTLRESVRAELRLQQEAIAAAHARAALENSRFLKIAGENTALKAGMILLRTYPKNESARRTLEEQLHELGERMGFDFMLFSGPDGAALAGVLRRDAQLLPLSLSDVQAGKAGLLLVEGRLLSVGSVPMDENDANIGRLIVGEAFELKDLTTPAVLVRGPKVLASNMPTVFVSQHWELTRPTRSICALPSAALVAQEFGAVR